MVVHYYWLGLYRTRYYFICFSISLVPNIVVMLKKYGRRFIQKAQFSETNCVYSNAISFNYISIE